MIRKGHGSEGDAYRYTKKVLLGEYKYTGFISFIGGPVAIEVKDEFKRRAEAESNQNKRCFLRLYAD